MKVTIPFSMFLKIVLVAILLNVGGCSKENAKSFEPEKPTPSTRREVKAPEALLIEPQSGVGKVRRGMTEQEVIEGMGQPDSKNSGFLVYSQLGILFGIGKDGVVFSARFRKPFNGSTVEGIQLGSTRAEVIHAYGETDQAKMTKSGSEVLHYPKPMMRFFLKGEVVTEIVIDLLKP